MTSWRQPLRTMVGMLFLIALVSAAFFDLRGLSVFSESGGIQVVFFSLTNDADCILLYRGEEGVMIDTGESQDAQRIISLLNRNGITRISHLILTHPDKDHIGGAEEILRVFPVGQVILPPYEKSHQQLENLLETAKERQVLITQPATTKSYAFNDVILTVYPPLERSYQRDNDYSLCVLATHGRVKMFFAGDAEKKRTEELLLMNLPTVDMYKVADHGRANQNSGQLMAILQPKWAVVTGSMADRELRTAISEMESRLLFTYEGDLLFFSDRRSLRLVAGKYNG